MTARADFLRNLPASDFCPPEGWAATVTGRPPTADALALQTSETADAVDEFAAEYWNLPPADRRVEWEKLVARPADAPTRAFLKHLKGGLTVGPITSPGDDFVGRELATVCRELFTLRPRSRSVRRLAWLDTREPSVDWPAAVSRLRQTDPESAGLAHHLVQFLEDASPPPTAVLEREGSHADSVSSPTFGQAYSVDSHSPVRDPDRPRRRRRERDDDAESSGGSPWLGRLGIGGVVVAILIVIRVIAACAGAGSRMQSNSPSYTPAYTVPTFTVPTGLTRPTGPGEVGSYTFSDEEVRSFHAYRSQRSGLLPGRYLLWIRCGMPAANTPTRPIIGGNR